MPGTGSESGNVTGRLVPIDIALDSAATAANNPDFMYASQQFLFKILT